MWREITPVNLNPSLVLLLSNLMHEEPPESTIPTALAILFAPSSCGQYIPGVTYVPANFYSQLQWVTWSFSLWNKWKKEKVTDAWDRGCCIDCFRTKKTCLQVSSKSVIGNFCKYPASPKTERQWKREKKPHVTITVPIISLLKWPSTLLSILCILISYYYFKGLF